MPSTTPATAGIASSEAGAEVDVAVDAALGERAEQADEDDRGEAGAGREPLAVAEPEDQQGDDDAAAADAEEAAEDAGEGADRGQPQGAIGDHRAILDGVSGETASSNGDARAALLEALRADPARTAILTDIDGTLAPIVERPEQAAVPSGGRASCSAALSERYGAGRLRLRPAGRRGAAAGRPRRDRLRRQPRPRAAAARRRGGAARSLARGARGRGAGVPRRARRRTSSAAIGLRTEDKGPIQALHWRGAEDERAAEARAREIAADAGRAGLEPHWGRKVLELRPVGGGGKDAAVAALLAADGVTAAAYAGDDRTDLDAFRRLRELREEGELETAICVGVTSPEAPPELAEESDLSVDGPAGWLAILESLAA